MNFSKKALQLMIISMVLNFATLLSGVFVNIFLWKITSDMLSIAKYNLVMYASLTLVFPVFSYLSKRHSATLVFRISIIFQILYFISIILSGDRAADYINLFGVFTGIGTAASANSTNQLTVQYTKPENRSQFLSISGTLNSIAAMVSPFLAGIVINLFSELTGYYIVFAFSMILYMLAFGMSVWFVQKIPKREFVFFQVFRHCPTAMKKVNATQFFIGVRDGIFGFLINILIFDIVQTESIFGTATAASKMVVVLTYWVAGKYINRDNLYRHLHYSMWLMFAAPIPLFLFAGQMGVVLQMTMDAVASPLVAITLNSLMYNNIESIIRLDNLEELLAVKEVWLNIGKVAGVAGFMILYPLLRLQWVFALILITNLCYVFSYYIYRCLEEKKIEALIKSEKEYR